VYLDDNRQATTDNYSIKYVLVKVINKNSEENITGLRIQGVYQFETWLFVTKYEVPETDFILCYANVADVHYTHGNGMRAIGSLVCQNPTYMPGHDKYQGWYEYVEKYYNRRRSPASYVTSYCECETIDQRITQHHHSHLLPTESLHPVASSKVSVCPHCHHNKLVLCGVFADLVNMARSINNIKSTHSTFFAYYMLAKPWAQKFILGCHYISVDANIDLMSMFKTEGIMAKQVQGLYSNDMNQIFELNVLVNRLDSEIDWEAEQLHRSKPNTVPIKYDDVYSLSKVAFLTAKQQGARPHRYTWSSFWKMRYANTPGGAVHSNNISDNNAIHNIDAKYRNKKTVFCSMRNTEFSKFYERVPMITAKTSIKYEWGKVRALYGCDMTSHLMADFGLARCEETLPNWMPTGSAASESNIAKLMMSMQSGVPVCYDYDDFNSQHSIESMQAVLRAWLDVYGDTLTDEQIIAVNWTILSVDKMFVVNRYNGVDYQASGTLFSGWRLTSFINTVLNWVYLENSNMSVAAVASIHNGDDVFAITNTVGDAMSMISQARRSGIRAQIDKMNIGTIAEFLRMDLRATFLTGRQYLTRACATLTHARVETTQPNSAADVLEADNERLTSLELRGGRKCVINTYKKLIYSQVARVFSLDDEIIKNINTLPRVLGGFSDEKVPVGLVVKKTKIGDREEKAVDIINKMRPGLNDYVDMVAYLLSIEREKLDEQQIMDTVERQMTVFKTGLSIEPIDIKEAGLLIGLHHAWQSVIDVAKLSLARTITKDISLVDLRDYPGYCKILRDSGRPLHWLSILI